MHWFFHLGTKGAISIHCMIHVFPLKIKIGAFDATTPYVPSALRCLACFEDNNNPSGAEISSGTIDSQDDPIDRFAPAQRLTSWIFLSGFLPGNSKIQEPYLELQGQDLLFCQNFQHVVSDSPGFFKIAF